MIGPDACPAPGHAHQMLQVTILGKEGADEGAVEESRSSSSASNRSSRRREDRNLLTQITVKNPWSLLK